METPRDENGQQLILSEEVYNGVAEILDETLANTRAEAVVFCESNGYPILQKGDFRGLDLPGISSLAANNFSATSKMASMVGESGSFKYLFHEGEHNNIYLSNVGFNFILMVIFRADVALGIIRVYTKKAIEQLTELLRCAKKEEDKTKEFLDLEFKSLLSEEINRSLKS
ncbi:roadblock/LC7 domain-containing protein [candidate division KSB1 bacterium]|nr:roadblock/LC7 domain-containing protein [candidate division KSB1 bacterium]NIR73455.1 roadblock/LC7 domain-containing protein [candidate division KSB1 bacterium]NIS27070.1 roadblock/LC7 domain-containing protein [candidate division KSB1 bacterium]NIT73914.1 roadblock/LC7 domain-containing protein [candidate division KSB1 bacterium]NIU27815.1 roadblock/LC7 domain-containing protein [candidate division KSB1 bacterium]